MWGSYVDDQLELAGRDPKELKSKAYTAALRRRQQVLERLMNDPVADGEEQKEVKPTVGKFKDPASIVREGKEVAKRE